MVVYEVMYSNIPKKRLICYPPQILKLNNLNSVEEAKLHLKPHLRTKGLCQASRANPC